jgi:hypothetical protein
VKEVLCPSDGGCATAPTGPTSPGACPPARGFPAAVAGCRFARCAGRAGARRGAAVNAAAHPARPCRPMLGRASPTCSAALRAAAGPGGRAAMRTFGRSALLRPMEDVD